MSNASPCRSARRRIPCSKSFPTPSAMPCAASAPASTRSPSRRSTCAPGWRDHRLEPRLRRPRADPGALHRRRRRPLAAAAMDRRSRRRGLARADRRGRRRADAAAARARHRRRPRGGRRRPRRGRAAERRQRRYRPASRPQLVPAGGLAAARSAARARRAPLRVPAVRARPPAPAFDGTPGRDAVLAAIKEYGLASGCLIGTYERPDASIKAPVDESGAAGDRPAARDLSVAAGADARPGAANGAQAISPGGLRPAIGRRSRTARRPGRPRILDRQQALLRSRRRPAPRSRRARRRWRRRDGTARRSASRCGRATRRPRAPSRRRRRAPRPRRR